MAKQNKKSEGQVIEAEPPAPEAEIETTALVPAAPPVQALGVFREPRQVLREAKEAADTLMEVVRSKKGGVRFNGETFLEYEDWLTLARFYSMTPRLKATRQVEVDGAKGWEATVDVLLIPTNQVIGSADAMCLRDEANWARKPSFQLRSMAQTRAGSKALANVLRWIVVLANFKGTPAEEMTMGELAANGNGAKMPAPMPPPTPAPVVQAAATGLPEVVSLDEYKLWLTNCRKLDELTRFFSRGYKQFWRDPEAQAELRHIYEIKKVELGGTPNPEGKTKKSNGKKETNGKNGRS